MDQLNAIFKHLGTPNDKIWPEYSELPLVKKVTFADHKYNNMANRLGQKLTNKGFDLLNRFLTYCPSRRITADEALKHDQQSANSLSRNSQLAGDHYEKLIEGQGFHMRSPVDGKASKGEGFALKF
ncbi:unnamed protein product [Medioppia subpectinata]|uniref:Uncharacterized protein n=1 Tax=Medioppia subpectinata TaxID=1979941 RepID=A0A7R9L1G0_9ACAR|nr:unnamed protein product [Medioppia subpectinata]CAG2112548.1 unnamed protein product [Medioppia subpectinata]